MGNLYSKHSTISEPQVINQIVSQSQKVNREEQMKKVQNEGLELFQKKNADYGDAFANYGAIGVLVRLGDKISRCQSISNKSVSLVNSESLRDTLIDLHNYAAMAIMLIDEDENKKIKLQRQATTTSEIVKEVMAGNKVMLE